MNVCAAVMTGQGPGAIATIQLCGDGVPAVLRTLLRPKGGQPFVPAQGRVILGDMIDRGAILDEVAIGCESPHFLALHCHGNPLIVQRIMEVLQEQGVQAVPPEQMLVRMLASAKGDDGINLEAKLALTTVKTMEGAALVANQIGAGLSQKVRQWRDNLDSMPPAEIVAEARDILARSEPARLIISGCTIALIGPPNTGKSTLLNTLAGREKAIVSALGGTTRDWVSAEIRLPPLAVTLIDTAGLDPAPAAAIDRTVQQKSLDIISRADLVLLVLDISQPAELLRQSTIDRLAGAKVITVLNKADLSPHCDPADLPAPLQDVVRLSAKQGTGLDDLIHAIHRVCGVAAFDAGAPIVFTDRQRRLLESLQQSDSQATTRSILSDLLKSPAVSSLP
jgi:tRNA modification GTPase